MTRACVDVFKQFGAEIPPISGEGNNGFFGQWIRDGFKSVSAEYAPAQGLPVCVLLSPCWKARN